LLAKLHFVDAIIMAPNRGTFWATALPLAAVVLLLAGVAEASVGDKLPEFKQCLDVRVPYISLLPLYLN
jgi:hypothetical protein